MKKHHNDGVMNPLFLLVVATLVIGIVAIRRVLRARNWIGLLGMGAAAVALVAAIGAWHAYMVVDSIKLALAYCGVMGLGVIGAMRWLLPAWW